MLCHCNLVGRTMEISSQGQNSWQKKSRFGKFSSKVRRWAQPFSVQENSEFQAAIDAGNIYILKSSFLLQPFSVTPLFMGVLILFQDRLWNITHDLPAYIDSFVTNFQCGDRFKHVPLNWGGGKNILIWKFLEETFRCKKCWKYFVDFK